MPTTDGNIKNIILNSAGGKCNTKSISVEPGTSFTLPTPTRRGYVFEGWYTRVVDGEKIDDNDTAILEYDELYARWTLEETKIQQKKKSTSMIKKQKRAVIVMIVAVILLAIALGFVNYIVDIYRFEDINQDTYYIKKEGGVYALYSDDGKKCDKTPDGYFQTSLGTQLKINAQTGEIEDAIYVDDIEYMHKDEIRGSSGRLLMFKQMTYDRYSTTNQSKIIKSLKINNEFGGYTFIRNKDMQFVIEGREELLYNTETFAMLASACGYTLSMDTLRNPKLLSNGEVDFSEYGLATEVRERVETNENGEEIIVTYDYTPASFTIEAMTGEYHTVIIGDAIVSGQGYYAKYAGGKVLDENGNLVDVEPRDRIYILGESAIGDTLLRSVEALVTPMIIYPMGENEYYDVKNFDVSTNIDYERIEKEFEAIYADDIKGMTDKEIAEYFDKHPELQDKYIEIFNKYSKKICSFSYQDLSERENSMYTTLPYVSHVEYKSGYYINGTNIDDMLYKLATMEFVAVVKLNPTDEDLEKYNLKNSKYYIDFFFHDAEHDTEDEATYVYNTISVSEKTGDGMYYAYSEVFDMIVLVDESYFDFLEWDDSKWFDSQYIQLDISYITGIILESPNFNANMLFDNSGSRAATYVHGLGNIFTDSKKNQFNIKQNSLGKYSLFLSGEEISPTFSGDYMISSVPYSKGTPENDYFILMETTQVDLNSDEEADGIIHYGYNVIYSEGAYTLAATVVLTDLSGNQLSQTSQVTGEIEYSSEYFVTASGQLFFASKTSQLGKILTERYATTDLGAWHEGNVFVTANDKYILIDKKTGEWAKIDAYSCGVYFADKDDSALAKNAVRVAPVFDVAGNLITPEEFYYSTGNGKIRYNYEEGYVEVYKMSKKSWERASVADYTVGVWLSGSYYTMADRSFILIDEASGDWGVMNAAQSNSQGAQIYIDGEHLSYEFDTTTQAGNPVVRDAVYNFRQFYKGLLYASLEGIADLSDEEMQAFKKMDSFNGTNADNPCILKLTILSRDLYGNERNTVYRFYKYSERKAYITIEVLGENGESSSEQAYGTFYVLSSFAQKIISDVQKLIDGEEIFATSKY